MASEKEEQEVFNEFLNEAQEDSKQTESTGVSQGVAGIIIGIIGFFMPFGVQMIFATIGALLAIYANRHGQRRLAIPTAILATLNFLGLILGITF